MPDKLMTVEEVAEYLRVKPSTVYEWTKDGKIPAAKVGWLWRFDWADIEVWLKRRKGHTSVQQLDDNDASAAPVREARQ